MSFDDDNSSSVNCDGIDFKWMKEEIDSSGDEDDRNIGDGGGQLPYYNKYERSLVARLRWIIVRNPSTRRGMCGSEDTCTELASTKGNVLSWVQDCHKGHSRRGGTSLLK
ncbi:hypothetical protein PoB_002855700 [Plakobranchus ocellatus]|uniref:Uncharacterized protein n=1 Tax=Plakobranchus ocellatus TaxID=259542 RepID=A0AAV4A5C7_9GAST|nr:hypothetical protein PoB_002855700 [Plakobranchus ocellatus]